MTSELARASQAGTKISQHAPCLEQVTVCRTVGGERTHREAGEAARLRDVGGAVEAGGHHARPVAVHGCAVRIQKRFRHNCPAQPHAGEARILAVGARFKCDLLCT